MLWVKIQQKDGNVRILRSGKKAEIREHFSKNNEHNETVAVVEAAHDFVKAASETSDIPVKVVIGGTIIVESNPYPEFLSVFEVSKLLGKSMAEVTAMCETGNGIIATRRNGESGEWLIDSEQFMDRDNFHDIIETKEKIRENNNKIQSFMDLLSKGKEID
ncbi:hypothetical protein BIV60_11410 [Bacillus sp. MUM 116]|uniref:hypothetical protein n=1 Tax=Bacillus sp. MUM 116 TaxID=1678002 RepID=UPI0008F57475|nr:hypothetical protein [Bacillus sp. MUM 116]OIK14567.1 hypothetical protein BIV60_11410 [Bacillus sp. MUM 116]